MIIVVEGPDGAGKSTLAQRLSEATGLRVQQGSGPPRGPGEIETRAHQYLEMTDVIFDRHPLVSQHIYAELRREEVSEELHQLTDRLYQQSPLVIYCRSSNAARHVVKDGENPAHVETVHRRYDELVNYYDAWAFRRAHLLYRIGDDVDDLCRVVSRVASPMISSAYVVSDTLRRVNEAHRTVKGPAAIKNLGGVMTALIESVVAAVNQRLAPPLWKASRAWTHPPLRLSKDAVVATPPGSLVAPPPPRCSGMYDDGVADGNFSRCSSREGCRRLGCPARRWKSDSETREQYDARVGREPEHSEEDHENGCTERCAPPSSETR